MRAIAALVLALLLADCAPTSWHRAGTPPLDTQNDVERCWSEADAAIGRDAFSRPEQPPAFATVRVPDGKGGQGVMVVPERQTADPDAATLQERRRQYVANCMQALGYTADRN